MCDPAVLARSESKVSAAKVKILLKKDMAFFSAILMQLPTVFTTSIKTACTNGRVIKYNPEFVETLTADETIFLTMHELKHVILKHMGRLNGRDPKLWNVACDYVINGWLVELGYKMPKVGLYDANYVGMSADAVYLKLVQDRMNNPSAPQPQPDHDDLDQSLDGDVLDEEIDDLIVSGVIAAEQATDDSIGKVPGNVMRRYDELVNPKVPWHVLLNRFMFGVAKDDYSYRKPNRRYLAHGFILPSLHSTGMDQIDFAIDTSGSVSEDMMTEFLGEVANVFKKFNPECIGIMQFDHELKARNVIKSVNDFRNIKFTGGGGTDVMPVLEEFKANKAKALVIITDGYFHHDKSWNPGKPVIWVVYDNPSFKPPFGNVAYFDVTRE